MRILLLIIATWMLICSCGNVPNEHPQLIPGIPYGDIREQALRSVLYNGITRQDEKLLYLTNPDAAAKYSDATRFLFELLEGSAYMEGDMTYYHTLNVVPVF